MSDLIINAIDGTDLRLAETLTTGKYTVAENHTELAGLHNAHDGTCLLFGLAAQHGGPGDLIVVADTGTAVEIRSSISGFYPYCTDCEAPVGNPTGLVAAIEAGLTHADFTHYDELMEIE